MGIADRDYHRRDRRDGQAVMPRLTPVVKWLLISNIGIFILDYLILGKAVGTIHGFPPLVEWGAFRIWSAIMEFRIWEFITFQFLHGSLLHIMFNSISLFFFGPWMERWWGSKRFLIYYLLCGAGGAAFFTLLTFLHILPNGMHTYLIGASAGIFGILIGIAIIAPELRVMLLFPPVELTMRQVALGLLIFSTGAILFRLGGNEGGEAGHLGGAILGFFLMRYPNLLGATQRVSIHRQHAVRNRTEAKLRPRTTIRMDQDTEVDRILDKVSREGFQSLTDAERETLHQAAQRQNPHS